MSALIRTSHSMDSIAGKWSAISDGLYSLPNWLRTAEGREGERHYAVLDGDSGPQAGLVAYETGPAGWYFNNPVALLCHPLEALDPHFTAAERETLDRCRPQLAAAEERLYPALVSVLPSGYRPGLIRSREAGDSAVGELLEVLERLAADGGMATAAVMHVPEDDEALRTCLTERGYVPFVSAGDCILHTPWSDFEGYVASLRRPLPNRVRREVRTFEEAGGVLREVTMEALGEAHARLHMGHQRRHGHDVALERSTDLIHSIQVNRTGRGRVLEAWRGGTLVGFMVAYEFGTELHPKMIGMAEGEEKCFTYFNLCYYGMVRIAVASGLETIVYGPAAYAAKANRGCRLEKRISHVLAPPDLRQAVSAVAEAIDSAERRLLATYRWPRQDA